MAMIYKLKVNKGNDRGPTGAAFGPPLCYTYDTNSWKLWKEKLNPELEMVFLQIYLFTTLIYF